MAISAAELKIKISADTKNAKHDLDEIKNSVKSFEQVMMQAARTGFDKSNNEIARSLKGLEASTKGATEAQKAQAEEQKKSEEAGKKTAESIKKIGEAAKHLTGETVTLIGHVRSLGFELARTGQEIGARAFETLKAAGEKAFEVLKGGAEKAVEGLKRLAEIMAHLAEEGARKLIEGIREAGRIALEVGERAFHFLAESVKKAAEGFGELAKEAGKLTFEVLRSSGEIASRGLDELGKIALELGTHIARIGVEAGKALFEKLISGAERAGEALKRLGEESAHAVGDALVTGLEKAGEAASKAAEKIGEFGRRIAEVSVNAFVEGARHIAESLIEIAKRGAEAGLAIGAVVSKIAGDFQEMTTRIQNNTTLSVADTNLMREAIKRLGSESNVPFDQLGQGFMHITNFGFAAADATAILEAAMKSASSTGGNTAETANLLAEDMHIFGMRATDAAKAMDVLHLAAALGNSTLEQFSQATGTAYASAAQMGVSFIDASAAISAMTRQGVNADEATTRFNQALKHIIGPSKEAETELKKLSKASGIDLVGDFSAAGLKAKGFTGILDDIKKATGGNIDQLKMLFPEIRSFQGIMALTTSGAADYADILKQLGDAMSGKLQPTQDAYARTQENLNFQIGRLKNNLQILAINIGTSFLPALTEMVKKISDGVARFADWEQRTHAIANTVRNLASEFERAARPVAKFFESLFPLTSGGLNFKSLASGGFKLFEVAIDGLGKAVTRVIPVVLRELNKLVSDITSFFIRNDDRIKSSLQYWADKLWDWVAPMIPIALEELEKLAFNLYNWIVSKLPEIESFVKVWGDKFWQWIKPTIFTLLGELEKIVIYMGGWIADKAPVLLAHLGKWAKSFVEWIAPLLGDLYNALGGVVNSILVFITSHTPQILNTLSHWAKVFVEWVVPVLGDLLIRLGELAIAIVKWLDANHIKIANVLKKWTIAFVDWVKAVAPPLLKELEILAKEIGNWIVNKGPAFAHNLGEWIESFAKWADKIADKVFPELLKFADKILRWIIENAPRIAEQIFDWVKSFVDWVIKVGPGVLEKLEGVINAIFIWIKENGPGLAEKLLTWAEAFVQWVLPIAEKMIGNMLDTKSKLFAWIEQVAPGILDKLLDWGIQFVNFIIPFVGKMIAELGKMLTVILNWIADKAPAILDQLLTWAQALLDWVEPIIPPLIDAIGKLVSTIINWLASHARVILDAAKKLFFTIVHAVESQLPAIIGAIGRLVGEIARWFADNANYFLDEAFQFFQIIADAVLPQLPAIVSALAELVGNIASWFASHASLILDDVLKFFFVIVNAIEPQLPKIVDALLTLVTEIIGWFDRNSNILDGALRFFQIIVGAVKPHLPKLIDAILFLIQDVVTWLGNHATLILDGFMSLFKVIWQAVKPHIGPLLNAILNLIQDVVAWLAQPAQVNFILNAFKDLFFIIVGAVQPHIKPLLAEFNKLIGSVVAWLKEPDQITNILNAAASLFATLFQAVTSPGPSGKSVLDNILDGLTTVISQVVLWLTKPEQIKAILDGAATLFAALVNALVNPTSNGKSVLENLKDAVFSLIGSVVNWFLDPINQKKILDGAGTLFSGIWKALTGDDFKLDLTGAGGGLGTMLKNVLDWFSKEDNVKSILDGAYNLFKGIVNAVTEKGSDGDSILDKVENALLGLIKGILAFLKDHSSEMATGAMDLLNGLCDKFKDQEEPIGKLLGGILADIAKSAADNFVKSFKAKMGENLLDPNKILDMLIPGWGLFKGIVEGFMEALGFHVPTGLAKGINSNSKVATDAAKKLHDDTAKAYADAAIIRSPSEVFQGFGKFLVDGLTLGMLNNKSSAESQSTAIASSVIAKFNTEIAKVNMDGIKTAIQSWITNNTYSLQYTFYTLGYSIAQGIKQGIEGGSYLITNAANKAAWDAYIAAKNTLGVKSPSKIFAELGMYSMQGLAIGIAEHSAGPQKEMVRAMKGLISSASISPSASRNGAGTYAALVPGGAASYNNSISNANNTQSSVINNSYNLTATYHTPSAEHPAELLRKVQLLNSRT